MMRPLLRIETRRVEPDIMVLEFTGKITMGPGSKSTEEAVLELLRHNETKFIFDLSAVEYVDSMGMGSIAYCFAKVMRAEGGFRVAGTSDRVRQLFKITRMDTVLSFYPTVAAACADFTITKYPGQNPW